MKVSFEEKYIEPKTCRCGCGYVFQERRIALKINFSGKLESMEECVCVIEKLEQKVNEIAKEQTVCYCCGKCCLKAPEVSGREIGYFVSNYHIEESIYEKILPTAPCVHGGCHIGPCYLDRYLRPLQCRILFCPLEIENFEQFYNKFAEFLGWRKL
mgnify:CR=1 FL=1